MFLQAGRDRPHRCGKHRRLGATARAQTFSAEIKPNLGGAVEGLQSLSDAAYLHSLVTVVDSSTFLAHLSSIENLEQLGMATGKDDTRPLAFLLAEQVQFANKVLLNKMDLVSPEEASKIEALLRRLNPTAEIQRTQNSVIDVPALLAKQLYDEVSAVSAAFFSLAILLPLHYLMGLAS